ncbi:MAG: DUF2267 domain-containing protein [Verrucomicrobia bacterium]|nr:DUF2267 domain-containing protein [Verrucomicrobiota bacterium]
MDELKAQLMEKLGLDETTSTQAIETVLGFVKDKLPENISGMLDSALSGGGDIGGGLMDAAKSKLGGILGGLGSD